VLGMRAAPQPAGRANRCADSLPAAAGILRLHPLPELEQAAYALCRPPGHHTTRSAYGGSCPKMMTRLSRASTSAIRFAGPLGKLPGRTKCGAAGSPINHEG
jgi:hypothetical protein